MNLKALIFLVAVLGLVTWFLGNGIDSIQKENTQEDVLGNTLDAAKSAASKMGD